MGFNSGTALSEKLYPKNNNLLAHVVVRQSSKLTEPSIPIDGTDSNRNNWVTLD